ncbi:hypothetical protein, partial [Halochromatium sp.]
MTRLTCLMVCLLVLTTAHAEEFPMVDAEGPTAGRVLVDANGAQPRILIRIDDRHRTLVAGWYVVAFSDGLWWQRRADGGWFAWRGDYNDLGSLGVSRPEIVGYPVDLSELPGVSGEVAVYAGYQLVDGTWVFSENPAIIERPREQSTAFERETWNEAAYIPSQCYTDTIADNRVYNPCFSCHTESRAPNALNDGDLQTTYAFPKPARTNRWINLFRDRSKQMAAIPETAILQWVREHNYPALAARLMVDLPTAWDANGDGLWSGYVPDCHYRFDEQGFDRAPDGTPSGWRAYGYYPFPGTFWPTNGSTGDVLIRLAEPLRNNEAGEYDEAIYRVNLAIVEAMIKERDVALVPPVAETDVGVDLDADGRLGTADHVRWSEHERVQSYVGAARVEQNAGRLHLAAGLFPEGTEFLHSVRYIDPDTDNGLGMANRMKELRYARKGDWVNEDALRHQVWHEALEKLGSPDRLRKITGSHETGLSNGQGWFYQGFIEDANGELRPQTREELTFCMGCHGGVGATRDGIFSFARKLDGRDAGGGWFHWSQRGLAGIPEPIRPDGQPEYAFYLQHNGAGDEFRANAEVIARFFDANGTLRPDMLMRLREDISVLLRPSRQRALDLNRAYRVIVREQSF